jgi:hypothetical protein
MNKVLLAPLDDGEQQVLLELMRRLVSAADNYRDPGAAVL